MIEPIRLALGYLGNLNESVGWLGPFMMITVAPQMIVHVYFFFGQTIVGWITLEAARADQPLPLPHTHTPSHPPTPPPPPPPAAATRRPSPARAARRVRAD